MDSSPAAPPPPPPWATRTVAEDGWITHETVSQVHPQAMLHWPPREQGDIRPVEISISVVDRWAAGRWVRSEPTVQVEGGAYPLAQVAERLRALGDVARLSGRSPAA
jgi:hypothetical protein